MHKLSEKLIMNIKYEIIERLVLKKNQLTININLLIKKSFKIIKQTESSLNKSSSFCDKASPCSCVPHGVRMEVDHFKSGVSRRGSKDDGIFFEQGIGLNLKYIDSSIKSVEIMS